MQLEELMQTLCEELGVENVEPNESGVIEIAVDEDVQILIESAPEAAAIVFSASIAPIDASLGADAFRVLLEANLNIEETAGTALSIDAEEGEFVLVRMLRPDDLTFETFDVELATFVTVLREWRQRLGRGDLGQEAETDPIEQKDHNPILRV